MATFRSLRWFLALTALVVMLQLLAVQAMAVNPSLHENCHDHSHHPEHTCLVTLILNGGYQCNLPDIVPVTIATKPAIMPTSIASINIILPYCGLGRVIIDAPPRGP